MGLQFTYDENMLNSRLIECKINGNISLSTSYQNNGNIDSKSDVGIYSYNSTKPHALKTVVNPDPNFIEYCPLQQISYTGFGKVKSIDQENPDSPENPYHMDFTYGPDDQRIHTDLYCGETKIESKIYAGSGYEIITDAIGNKIQLHYLTSPSGVFAVYVKANSSESIYYIHKDHLGSLYAISDEMGQVVTHNGIKEVYSFDAWGRRRNPQNWTYEGLQTSFLIDRGFTFHEHLDEFGLINMNGRMYDPVIGRFFSPDNYVQGGMTQSYNRYSYCQNNPLIYTDPDGEKWWHWALAELLTGGAVSLTSIATYSAALATSITAQPTLSAIDYTSIWFKAFDDPGAAGKSFDNAIEIDAGMVMLTPGEEIQGLLGNAYSHMRNLQGKVTNVEVGLNYVLVNDKNDDERWGMTLGTYINSGGIRDTYKHDPLFVHEFGHTVQSKLFGPLYLQKVGYPSGISGYLDYYTKSDHNHDNTWFEINSNQFGQLFYDPIYTNPNDEINYSTSFDSIDWQWFLFFNPFIF